MAAPLASLHALDTLFDGPGEMRGRCRDIAWSATAVGPIDQWGQHLRTAVQITLANPSPAIILWGEDLIQVYNDAYRDLMGVKHPRGLSQPTRDCWPEVWHINAPIYERVFRGESFAVEDALYPITRSGVLEDAWFTLAYVPVREDRGGVSGVLVTVQETTARVLAVREHTEMLAALVLERERLKDAFRKAPSFIAMLDGPDMRFSFVNEAYSRLVGQREVVGKTLLDALPELAGQGFSELMEQVRDTGTPWVGHETAVQLTQSPGAAPETRYVNFIYHPIAAADGSRLGLVAHGSDVTE